MEIGNTPSLKDKSTLPRKATRVAEILSEYEDGASKEELKEDVKEDKYLDVEKMEKAIRMLRMTDNVEINEEKAHLVDNHFKCKGVRKDPFREWERKAKKENSDTLANIKKEQEAE